MSQREILFKAKRTDNGEWVEGIPKYAEYEIGNWYMITRVHGMDERFGHGNSGNVLLIHDAYEVDPETVCQYTGLTDKNGKKIFEEDIVVLDKGEEYEKNGFVSYSNGVFVIQFEKTWDFLCTNLEYAEIVGNIHDN